jgi:ABC-type lipoprotein release transport system permease subunit
MLMTLAWRNVWRNRLRSFIMMAAMIFGLLGVVLMVGFVRAMTVNMIENAIKYQTGHLQIHNPDFLVNEELAAWLQGAGKLAEEIRKQPEVAGVAVRQVVNGIMASAATNRGVRIHGVDMKEEALVTAVADSLVAGELLPEKGRNPILVSRRSARKLNLRIGSKVVLTFSDINGDVAGAAFRVTGMFNTPNSGFDEANVFVRYPDLAMLTGTEQAHDIAIRLVDGNSLEPMKLKFANMAGEKGRVRDWGEIQPILATMTGTMDISNTIMIAVFVLALSFGIVNIMLMSVFERSREFGMLMAIGMTRAKVLRLVVLESFLLGSVGGLMGLAASSLMIFIFGRIGLPFGAMAEGLGVYGMDTVLYPEVNFATYLSTFAMLVVTSVAAALYPARQVLKKNLSEALSEKH